ncbi:MAG: class I SAM-dependent methyltransferase [Ilumatobacteraceae bacterium]|nr:class I SAM-dependent methyltransferase [Ilumatobacteraceae bacterium]
MPRTVFNDLYYQHFYADNPVHTAEKIHQLATAVDALCAWWDLPVRTVLDIGAGPGIWRDWYHAHRPDVEVQSIDISEHACTAFGHEQKDITAWHPKKSVDLVICHSVLQYLSNAGAAAAIKNISLACHGVLYVEAPTAQDLESVVDPTATDLNIYRRTGAWYRKLLLINFQQIGAGLWLSRSAVVPLYELESASK